MKLATIEKPQVARRLGRLSVFDLEGVARGLRAALDL